MRISDWSSDVCSSDLHALAHTAGELVRILVDAPLGGRNANLMQQFHGALARSPVAEVAVGEDGFGELAADGVERVQRGLGVLEYHADVAATGAAKLLVRQVVDAGAVEADRRGVVWGKRGEEGEKLGG